MENFAKDMLAGNIEVSEHLAGLMRSKILRPMALSNDNRRIPYICFMQGYGEYGTSNYTPVNRYLLSHLEHDPAIGRYHGVRFFLYDGDHVGAAGFEHAYDARRKYRFDYDAQTEEVFLWP